MKATYLVMALAFLVSANATAQVGELYAAELNDKSTVSDPAKIIKAAEGEWLAFSLPVLKGTHSPCCWSGKWNHGGEIGCSLEKSHQSYGTRSDSPEVENVIVYSQINNGLVKSMRIVGEQCPMDAAGAEVTWIGSIETKAGLDWLEATASTNDTALYALALHRDDGANQRLYSMAKDVHGDLSEEAIFWLGEARGQAGFESLSKLLEELPKGATRRHINFALTQNNFSAATELLIEIAKSDPDPEQRGDALFWLAQERPEKAEALLLEIVYNEKDEDVLEQAVFAISQLPASRGNKMLLALARDKDASSEVRHLALFWLANSDDDEAVAALTELLTR